MHKFEKLIRKPTLLALMVLTLLLHAGAVRAQTSIFTYQGRFTDGGTPANGTYDMQFKLFDGAGNQIGSAITNGAVPVAGGVFTVQLDYGAAAFSGADRFLELGLRLAGSGDPYTVLAPRQFLTSTPYAIRSVTAETATNAAQLGGITASQYIQANDSRLSDARPPTANSSSYIQNTNSSQVANFNISGNGSASGVLSGNIVNAQAKYYLGGVRVLSAVDGNLSIGQDSATAGVANTVVGQSAGAASNQSGGSQNVFLGWKSGSSTTDGFQNSFVGSQSGLHTTTGMNNSSFGIGAGRNNTTGSNNTMIGGIADTVGGNLSNATAIGFAARVSQSNSLVLGSISDGTPDVADTNVGIGTTAPPFRLTVKTSTNSYGLVHTDGTITVGTYVGGSANGGYLGTKSNHSLNFFVSDGGPSLSIDTGGIVHLNTLGAAGSTSLCRNASNQISTCSSSLRYKKDLAPFTRGLALLSNLKPIVFKWKADNTPDLGFGAEDVAAVEPLLVTRNDKGEVEGVKYDRITAVLVNAVKEQQEQIKQQQNQIEGLKKLVCRSHRHAGVCK